MATPARTPEEERGHNERTDVHSAGPSGLQRERQDGRDERRHGGRQGDGRGGQQRDERNRPSERARRCETSLAEEVGRSAALPLSRCARPLFSDRESPAHTGGPDGTLSVMVVAGPGARGHWNDGYNVVGASDSDALGGASSTVGGYVALGALRQKARAMAGDAGRALRTLAAAVADGVGRAMTAIDGGVAGWAAWREGAVAAEVWRRVVRWPFRDAPRLRPRGVRIFGSAHTYLPTYVPPLRAKSAQPRELPDSAYEV